MDTSPPVIAIISAVSPSGFAESTFAPASSNILTKRALDCRAASVRGVTPNALAAFTSAFLAINACRDFIIRAIDRPDQRTGAVGLGAIDVRPGLNLLECQLGVAGLNERREILRGLLRLLRPAPESPAPKARAPTAAAHNTARLKRFTCISPMPPKQLPRPTCHSTPRRPSRRHTKTSTDLSTCGEGPRERRPPACPGGLRRP